MEFCRMGTTGKIGGFSLIGNLVGLERLSMYNRTYVKDGIVLRHVVDNERCSGSALEEYPICLAG